MFRMTRLMKDAMKRLEAMPESMQDSFAALLIREIEEDARWAETTRENQTTFRKIVDQVLTDDAEGLTEPLDPDRL